MPSLNYPGSTGAGPQHLWEGGVSAHSAGGSTWADGGLWTLDHTLQTAKLHPVDGSAAPGAAGQRGLPSPGRCWTPGLTLRAPGRGLVMGHPARDSPCLCVYHHLVFR